MKRLSMQRYFIWTTFSLESFLEDLWLYQPLRRSDASLSRSVTPLVKVCLDTSLLLIPGWLSSFAQSLTHIFYDFNFYIHVTCHSLDILLFYSPLGSSLTPHSTSSSTLSVYTFPFFDGSFHYHLLAIALTPGHSAFPHFPVHQYWQFICSHPFCLFSYQKITP